ncbi:MAG: phosphoribosyltransferase [Phototrophicaceae bacterium]
MFSEPQGEDRPLILSWADIDQLVDVLIPQLKAIGSFDAMVMITRGGVIPGGMLAEALDIQHLLTAAVDFPLNNNRLVSWPAFLQFPESSLLEGRRTLIVDDVWGSGRTSIAVRGRVIAASAKAFNCVLHYNPYRSLFSNMAPDFYGAVTDKYVVYPWEMNRGLRGIAMGNPELG